MQLRQAMADLAEVRGRLATVQRFDGYSAQGAIASGLVAIAAGGVQFALLPHPSTVAGFRTYLLLWLGCLAVALAVNYGAILAWRARQLGHGAGPQVSRGR